MKESNPINLLQALRCNTGCLIDHGKQISAVGLQIQEIGHLPTHVVFSDRGLNIDVVKTLFLSNNYITSLDLIEQFRNLEILSVTNNMICYLENIASLQYLPYLRKLSLTGNGITKLPYYEEFVYHFCPQLESLDGRKITEDDKARLKMSYSLAKSYYQKAIGNATRNTLLQNVLSLSLCHNEMASNIFGRLRFLHHTHVGDIFPTKSYDSRMHDIWRILREGGVFDWFFQSSQHDFSIYIQNSLYKVKVKYKQHFQSMEGKENQRNTTLQDANSPAGKKSPTSKQPSIAQREVENEEVLQLLFHLQERECDTYMFKYTQLHPSDSLEENSLLHGHKGLELAFDDIPHTIASSQPGQSSVLYASNHTSQQTRQLKQSVAQGMMVSRTSFEEGENSSAILRRSVSPPSNNKLQPISNNKKKPYNVRFQLPATVKFISPIKNHSEYDLESDEHDVIDHAEGTKQGLTVGMKATSSTTITRNYNPIAVPPLRIKSSIKYARQTSITAAATTTATTSVTQSRESAVLINKLNDTNTSNVREQLQDEYVRLLTSHPPQTLRSIPATTFTASSFSSKKENSNSEQGKGPGMSVELKRSVSPRIATQKRSQETDVNRSSTSISPPIGRVVITEKSMNSSSNETISNTIRRSWDKTLSSSSSNSLNNISSKQLTGSSKGSATQSIEENKDEVKEEAKESMQRLQGMLSSFRQNQFEQQQEQELKQEEEEDQQQEQSQFAETEAIFDFQEDEDNDDDSLVEIGSKKEEPPRGDGSDKERKKVRFSQDDDDNRIVPGLLTTTQNESTYPLNKQLNEQRQAKESVVNQIEMNMSQKILTNIPNETVSTSIIAPSPRSFSSSAKLSVTTSISSSTMSTRDTKTMSTLLQRNQSSEKISSVNSESAVKDDLEATVVSTDNEMEEKKISEKAIPESNTINPMQHIAHSSWQGLYSNREEELDDILHFIDYMHQLTPATRNNEEEVSLSSKMEKEIDSWGDILIQTLQEQYNKLFFSLANAIPEPPQPTFTYSPSSIIPLTSSITSLSDGIPPPPPPPLPPNSTPTSSSVSRQSMQDLKQLIAQNSKQYLQLIQSESSLIEYTKAIVQKAGGMNRQLLQQYHNESLFLLQGYSSLLTATLPTALRPLVLSPSHQQQVTNHTEEVNGFVSETKIQAWQTRLTYAQQIQQVYQQELTSLRNENSLQTTKLKDHYAQHIDEEIHIILRMEQHERILKEEVKTTETKLLSLPLSKFRLALLTRYLPTLSTTATAEKQAHLLPPFIDYDELPLPYITSQSDTHLKQRIFLAWKGFTRLLCKYHKFQSRKEYQDNQCLLQTIFSQWKRYSMISKQSLIYDKQKRYCKKRKVFRCWLQSIRIKHQQVYEQEKKIVRFRARYALQLWQSRRKRYQQVMQRDARLSLYASLFLLVRSYRAWKGYTLQQKRQYMAYTLRITRDQLQCKFNQWVACYYAVNQPTHQGNMFYKVQTLQKHLKQRRVRTVFHSWYGYYLLRRDFYWFRSKKMSWKRWRQWVLGRKRRKEYQWQRRVGLVPTIMQSIPTLLTNTQLPRTSQFYLMKRMKLYWKRWYKHIFPSTNANAVTTTSREMLRNSYKQRIYHHWLQHNFILWIKRLYIHLEHGQSHVYYKQVADCYASGGQIKLPRNAVATERVKQFVKCKRHRMLWKSVLKWLAYTVCRKAKATSRYQSDEVASIVSGRQSQEDVQVIRSLDSFKRRERKEVNFSHSEEGISLRTRTIEASELRLQSYKSLRESSLSSSSSLDSNKSIATRNPPVNNKQKRGRRHTQEEEESIMECIHDHHILRIMKRIFQYMHTTVLTTWRLACAHYTQVIPDLLPPRQPAANNTKPYPPNSYEHRKHVLLEQRDDLRSDLASLQTAMSSYEVLLASKTDTLQHLTTIQQDNAQSLSVIEQQVHQTKQENHRLTKQTEECRKVLFLLKEEVAMVSSSSAGGGANTVQKHLTVLSNKQPTEDMIHETSLLETEYEQLKQSLQDYTKKYELLQQTIHQYEAEKIKLQAEQDRLLAHRKELLTQLTSSSELLQTTLQEYTVQYNQRQAEMDELTELRDQLRSKLAGYQAREVELTAKITQYQQTKQAAALITASATRIDDMKIQAKEAVNQGMLKVVGEVQSKPAYLLPMPVIRTVCSSNVTGVGKRLAEWQDPMEEYVLHSLPSISTTTVTTAIATATEKPSPTAMITPNKHNTVKPSTPSPSSATPSPSSSSSSASSLSSSAHTSPSSDNINTITTNDNKRQHHRKPPLPITLHQKKKSTTSSNSNNNVKEEEGGRSRQQSISSIHSTNSVHSMHSNTSNSSQGSELHALHLFTPPPLPPPAPPSPRPIPTIPILSTTSSTIPVTTSVMKEDVLLSQIHSVSQRLRLTLATPTTPPTTN